MPSLPTLRWGVIGTGQVTSWFVRDLARPRKDAKANHIVQAIGSSSKTKGEAFVEEYVPGLSPAPTVYGSYQQVYDDPSVDIVYIGTPNAFHKQSCLDAIASGKHVLCEKAFAINAREAREVFAAAEKKGVFVMEALRMRFFPLVEHLLKVVHEDKAIGTVHRMFCDLGLDMDVSTLGQDSRLRNPALGAGTLLDICIYSLTWGLLLLDPTRKADTKVLGAQTLFEGVDTATSVILSVPSTGAQGILTSTSMARTPHVFCRIEGTKGHITVEGESASIPSAYTVYYKLPQHSEGDVVSVSTQEEKVSLETPGWGLYWEADAAAMDIAAGRTQNDRMSWSETLRVMEMMDKVRKQGGAKFPQDDE
ncbi:oxidoreductase family, NAD-binding rossmann fold domain-containing protein [Sarocladium implicatum]|nr:oxidoreductase family, NAD-binding rossmann fold domain-containing protein [Sarocladium implicatum]